MARCCVQCLLLLGILFVSACSSHSSKSSEVGEITLSAKLMVKLVLPAYQRNLYIQKGRVVEESKIKPHQLFCRLHFKFSQESARWVKPGHFVLERITRRIILYPTSVEVTMLGKPNIDIPPIKTQITHFHFLSAQFVDDLSLICHQTYSKTESGIFLDLIQRTISPIILFQMSAGENSPILSTLTQ